MEKSRKRISLLIIAAACFLLVLCQGLRGQTPPQSRFHEQVDRPHVARCYQLEKGELVNGSGAWVNYVGPSYLFTTVNDMARWMDNFRTKKIGGPELVEKMFKKTTLNNGSESFYGFGLGVSERSGKLTIGHSGQTAGYKTGMLYCPELELGIAVLANERSIDSEGLANRIFDLYLGNPEAAPAVSVKKQEFLPFNPEAAAAFAGGYIVEGVKAKLAVNAEEGFLHGAIFGLGEVVFYPTAERTFSNRSGENQVEFSDISNGQSQTAMNTVHGKKMTARRIVLDAKDLETRLPGYSGSYYSEAFGTAYSFRAENGRLIMHHRRQGDLRMQAIDADEFLCLLGFVKFNRDPKGEVTGFTLTPSDEKFNFQGFEFIKVHSGYEQDAGMQEMTHPEEEWQNRLQPPEKIMDAIGLKPGMVIGEVGAGWGRFTVHLARRVGNNGLVYANDIDKGVLDILDQRSKREGLNNIRIVLGQLHDPCFPPRSLDMAFMINVYNAFEDPVRFLRNIAPALKPGGTLAIVLDDPAKSGGESAKSATREQFLASVDKAGYKVEKEETFLERDGLYVLKLI